MYAESELKKDWHIVMAAVSNMAEMRADKRIVLRAVSNCGWVLKHADVKLKADREVVMAAVIGWPAALQDAHAELKADREFVMAAVSRCPDALQYAHVKLKADRQVVIAAVSKDGNCLQHADTTLRADVNVVKIAVSESGNALRFASPELRANVDLIVKAMRDAKRERLNWQSVRELVYKLVSDWAHMETDVHARPCPIFAPMTRPPFESWRHFERKLLESFWKEKPEGTHVLSNPVCEYLAADDLMRTTNVCRRSFWANCLGKPG